MPFFLACVFPPVGGPPSRDGPARGCRWEGGRRGKGSRSTGKEVPAGEVGEGDADRGRGKATGGKRGADGRGPGQAPLPVAIRCHRQRTSRQSINLVVMQMMGVESLSKSDMAPVTLCSAIIPQITRTCSTAPAKWSYGRRKPRMTVVWCVEVGEGRLWSKGEINRELMGACTVSHAMQLEQAAPSTLPVGRALALPDSDKRTRRLSRFSRIFFACGNSISMIVQAGDHGCIYCCPALCELENSCSSAASYLLLLPVLFAFRYCLIDWDPVGPNANRKQKGVP
eukprot:Gb_38820 [translate_table: standard]